MTPAKARKALNRSLDAHGETVVLRRLAGAGAGDYSVRARIVLADPSDVNASVQQLARKAIVSATDVETTGFPVPFLTRQDRLIWNGKTLVIEDADDTTRCVKGEIVGYDLDLSGA